MRRLVYAGLALLIGLETARAQVLQRPRYQSPTPTTSPYLNMIGGGNPAANYYGQVRPQKEMNRSLQSLQQEMQMMEQPALPGYSSPSGAGAPQPVSTTGHPVAFFNTSHYFPAPGQRPVAMSGVGTGMPQNNPNPGISPTLGFGFGGNGIQPFVGFNVNRR